MGPPERSARLRQAHHLSEQHRARFRVCLGDPGRPDAAEDAVQDVFRKALAADAIPEPAQPRLDRVAPNHCLHVSPCSRKAGARAEPVVKSRLFEALRTLPESSPL